MARIRSIKPEFFTSLTIADLPLSARLTFIGLWCYVDDNGVGLDEARLIRAAIWPLEETPDILQRTREDLQRLQEARLITRYGSSGKALLAITSWEEHQKVSHPRKPRYPRPEQVAREDAGPADQPEPERGPDSGTPPENFPSPPETLRPEQGSGSRDQGAGRRESAGAREPAQPTPTAPSRPDGRTPIPDDFALSDAMRRWAATTFPALDPDYETQQFISHHRAEGSRRRSWPDEWQKWMRRSAKYASERANRQLPLLAALPGGADRGLAARQAGRDFLDQLGEQLRQERHAQEGHSA